MKKLFKENGQIARQFENYEIRPQQIEMSEAIETSLTARRHLIVEAGTGIGKTFAYLVPAIQSALHNKRPVVISTHTINLQEQILNKDIPLLKNALEVDFTAALGKGRSNYLCLRRLNTSRHFQKNLIETSQEQSELKQLQQWSKKTDDGSLSDLDWLPINAVWLKVCCEQDNCAGKKCQSFKQCFYFRSRQKLKNASLVIVNHSLLLIDAMLRTRHNVNLLPDYQVLILDEAHRFETVAQEHLGLSISNAQVHYLLNRLYQPARNKGLLTLMKDAPPAWIECQRIIDETRNLTDEFFENVAMWLEEKAPNNGRIKKKLFVENILAPGLMKLHFSLKKVKTGLPKKPVRTRKKNQFDEVELEAYINRALALAGELDSFLQQTAAQTDELRPNGRKEKHVYWVEVTHRQRTQPRITLKSAPVNVSETLNEIFFNQNESAPETVVLTSATLAVDRKNGLGYIKNKLGVEEATELILNSPFNYKKQVSLYLTPALPDPNDKNSFEVAASDKILQYLKLSHGRAFVLFTSYDLMDRIYERLASPLMELKFWPYKQGQDLPRHQMLEAFKGKTGAVIFGADSFWQGVDVPGDALSNVIITKLPFPVPSTPLVEAKVEQMENEGIDSFMNYFIPEAIIKLRQGFGRLIRTKTDKGIIAILDNRILNKYYGRLFLNSLPECQIIVDK